MMQAVRRSAGLWIRRGGALAGIVLLLSALAVFAGCKGGGGPTGPSEDCSILKGGDPLGRWSDRKSSPWIKEYRTDGSYFFGPEGKERKSTYRMEGNILRYADGGWQYFETAGNALTTCAEGTKFIYYK